MCLEAPSPWDVIAMSSVLPKGEKGHSFAFPSGITTGHPAANLLFPILPFSRKATRCQCFTENCLWVD